MQQRRADYPHITVRTTPQGPTAFVFGTGLTVWETVTAYRALGEDAGITARHFDIDPALVEEALRYANRHGEEIEAAIEDHERYDFAALRQILPEAERFEVTDGPAPE